MKKVALIQPGKDERFSSNEPTNLGYIASYLMKHGVEVNIIDELAGQDVEKELGKYKPDIVGLTATTPLAPDAYRIAKICKSMDMVTVMGGVHASVLPDEALQYVDIVVIGEGEQAMLAIVKNGIRSGIVSRPYIKNLDDIPPPARHLMQMDYYLRTRERASSGYLGFIPLRAKAASLTTTRGCPYSCIYCHNTWRGIPYRFNSPERVVSEIKDLINGYKVQAIFFNEDNAFLHKPRLRRICELIKKNNIDIIWGGNSRVDDIDLDLLYMVKEAGCRQVSFGFESGSQRILNILNKKTTVEQNQRAIDLCKKVGIKINGTFMIGNPTETMEDIRATVDFIKRNEIDVLGIVITTPFPGTGLWSWCEKHNLIPENIDWNKLNLYECTIPACETVTAEEIKKIYEEVVEEVFGSRPVKLVPFVWERMSHPIDTLLKIFRSPSKIPKIIKRLRI